MEQTALWHDSSEDALEADIIACGGAKDVSLLLWPSENPCDGAKKIRRILNADRAEKFSEREREMIVRHAAARGSRCYAAHIAHVACAKVIGVAPEDVRSELMRDYVAAVNKLEEITKHMRKFEENQVA